MKTQTVYLAGGFNSNWRESVKSINMNLHDGAYFIKKFDFIDPKEKKEFQWPEYGCWDLHHIKNCDICFVYMERSNPSGFGLSVEIGYAKGLGKTVILVLETGHEKDKYLLFLRTVADVVYDNLEDGINFLASFR